MNHNDESFKKQLNEELDEFMFKDLHFDDQNINNVQSKMKQRHWKNIMSPKLVTLAAALLISVISIITFSQINQPEAQPPQDDGPQTLIEEPGTLSQGEPSVWRLDHLSQAKNGFEGELYIPTYIPERFDLKAIIANGEVSDTFSKITLEYFNKDQSFQIIQFKQEDQNVYLQGDSVEIHGHEAKIFVNEFKNAQGELMTTTELMWNDDGTQIVINGILNEKEAIKIAKSLKQ